MSDKLQEIKHFLTGSKELGYSSVVCDIESVTWLISQLEQALAEIKRLEESAKKDVDIIISYAVEKQKLIEALERIEKSPWWEEVDNLPAYYEGHKRIARQTLASVKQE